MKRLFAALLTAFALLLAVPAAAYAAPQGYMEVNVNKKNFKNYFQLKKMHRDDSDDNYGKVAFYFSSKKLAEGYYVYGTPNLSLKFSFKLRFQPMFGKKKTMKKTIKTRSLDDWLSGGDVYSVARLSKVKYKKVSGTVIFIEPGNYAGMRRMGRARGYANWIEYRIYVKHPYDANTPADEFGYYVTRYAEPGIEELQY